MGKRVCLLSFSYVARDARVLRQIKYLSPYYDLTIIGYGHPHPDWVKMSKIKWISLDSSERRNNRTGSLKMNNNLRRLFLNRFKGTMIIKFLRLLMSKSKVVADYLFIFLGRFHSSIYDRWYWSKKNHWLALEFATLSHFDAFHANDWNTLPIAAEAARIKHAKLIFDAHEYAPLELENRRYWKILFRPAIIHFMKKYSAQVDASLTVAPLISERYKKEFDLNTVVVLNVPESVSVPNRGSDFNNIRLIHHGGAIRDRRMERMIKTLALCDHRFTLHFMLINNDVHYLDYLKKLANEIAPGRVVFQQPVAPEEIVQRISEYDVGFYLLEPNSYNNEVALPNKFFDFIVAGLAVCIGPSPSMAAMVSKYRFGCIAPSFNPHDVAKALNQLTLNQLLMMRQASKEAAREINAEKEMSKLVELYNRLFDFH